MMLRKGNLAVSLEDALQASTAVDDEYIDPVESDYDIDEDDQREGDEICEDLATLDEAATGLESLITTMEAAAVDPAFGRYNLPLYHNEATRLYRLLGVSTFGLSTEHFDSPYVLSTEGLKETLSAVWKAFIDMLVRFGKWVASKFGKGSKSEKIEAAAQQLEKKAEAVAAKPEIKARASEVVGFGVELDSDFAQLLGERASLREIEIASKSLFRRYFEDYKKVGEFLRALDNATTAEAVKELVVSDKLLTQRERGKQTQQTMISVPVRPDAVYKATAAEILENKTLHNFSTKASELCTTLTKMSDEVSKSYLIEHHGATSAIHQAINGEISKADLDAAQAHNDKAKLLNQQRYALVLTISYLSNLINRVERSATQLLRINKAFYAALNQTE